MPNVTKAIFYKDLLNWKREKLREKTPTTLPMLADYLADKYLLINKRKENGNRMDTPIVILPWNHNDIYDRANELHYDLSSSYDTERVKRIVEELLEEDILERAWELADTEIREGDYSRYADEEEEEDYDDYSSSEEEEEDE